MMVKKHGIGAQDTLENQSLWKQKQTQKLANIFCLSLQKTPGGVGPILMFVMMCDALSDSAAQKCIG